ncbi:hypothetical protein [Herbiconiux liukaitaii]|uniref:hypothetical protein n=1 Tax=Herbiconiux liukaitaii TaxID=3342799 RepID=UPI0035B6ACA3
MSVDLLLRILARLLPPLARVRYLEEWRADAAGAAEAGLRRRDVVLGAAMLSLTIDRDLPAHTGEPRGMLPRRLSRRGFALLAAAASILIGAFLTGGGIVPEGAAASAGVVAALEAVGWVAIRLALLIAVLGALFLLRAAAVAETRTARATLVAAVVGPVLLLAGSAPPDSAFAGITLPAVPWWLPLVGLGIMLLALVGGVVVLGGTRAIALQHRTASHHARVVAALAGAALVVAVVVVGAIDLLVWNPLAKVPGRELSAIYASMEADDGFSFATSAIAVALWAGIWAGLALVALVMASRRRAAAFTPRRVAIVMLALVGGAIFFRFFAGFGIGMSIADTFVTSGGDASVVSAALPYVGQLALAGAAIAFGWAPRAAGSRAAVSGAGAPRDYPNSAPGSSANSTSG